jgi:hypothetical protein
MERSRTLLIVASVGAVLAASTAHAENEYDMGHTRPLASGHASDPFITPCTNPYTGLDGYCLYTSQDMGFQNSVSGSGSFMMGYTRVFFSTDGVNWQDEGIVATEEQFKDLGVPLGTYHFWAPCLFTRQSSADVREYQLYVPDVPRGGNNQYHYDAFIGLLTSNSPFGPFTAQGKVAQVTPYMSDPEVFPKGIDTSRTNGSRYLLWADGDGSTCGGLSIARMTGDRALESRSDYRITFSNISDMKAELGTCTPNVSLPPNYTKFDGPYLEGPSLYDLAGEMPSLRVTDKGGTSRKYMLVFPSKPSKVPAACATEGEPNSANQVIAYALSDFITGPYEYQGIIMCGSPTEWTNHMNLAEIKTPGGSSRPVIYYHDSADSSAAPHRKLLAECVYAVEGKIALIDRDTRDGLTWCTGNTPVFALRSASGKYVQENSYDGGNLRVRSTRVGAWEQFTLTAVPNTSNPQLWGIQARLTRQYLTANFASGGGGRLAASRDAIRDWERFTIVNNSDSTVSLQAVPAGGPAAKYVRIINGDQLVADQTSSSGAERFKMVYLWDN